MKNEQENPGEHDLSGFRKKQLQELLNEGEERRQWRKEMDANESLQAYFAGFKPESVKSFTEHLFVYKKMWLQYGPLYSERMETDGIEWINDAFGHLAAILQKKLFDIQCLWRADKLQMKDHIRVCHDFQKWEKNIFNCPFIEAISEEDVKLYIKFLMQSEEVHDSEWYEWQDYDGIMEAYHIDNASGEFPEWYDFYNMQKGTTVLLHLPDTRGEKEAFYYGLYHEAHRTEKEARHAEWIKERDNRPLLPTHDNKQMEWYVNTFENKETQKMYKAFEWSNRNRDMEETLQPDLELLLSADEPVAIEAHYNWTEGVRKAAAKYRIKKIAAALPQAWEQYMINIQTGIGFPKNDMLHYYDSMTQTCINQIIEGRILNGEPGDLDF